MSRIDRFFTIDRSPIYSSVHDSVYIVTELHVQQTMRLKRYLYRPFLEDRQISLFGSRFSCFLRGRSFFAYSFLWKEGVKNCLKTSKNQLKSNILKSNMYGHYKGFRKSPCTLLFWVYMKSQKSILDHHVWTYFAFSWKVTYFLKLENVKFPVTR